MYEGGSYKPGRKQSDTVPLNLSLSITNYICREPFLFFILCILDSKRSEAAQLKRNERHIQHLGENTATLERKWSPERCLSQRHNGQDLPPLVHTDGRLSESAACLKDA